MWGRGNSCVVMSTRGTLDGAAKYSPTHAAQELPTRSHEKER